MEIKTKKNVAVITKELDFKIRKIIFFRGSLKHLYSLSSWLLVFYKSIFLKLRIKITFQILENEFTKIILIEMTKLGNLTENENIMYSITELFYNLLK